MNFEQMLQCATFFRFSWLEIIWNVIWGGFISMLMYQWGFRNGQKTKPPKKWYEPEEPKL